MAQVPASLALLLWVLGRTVPTGHQGIGYHILQERLTFWEAHAACAQWGRRLVQAGGKAWWRQPRGTQSWWVGRPPVAGIHPPLQEGPLLAPHPCPWLWSLQGLLQQAAAPSPWKPTRSTPAPACQLQGDLPHSSSGRGVQKSPEAAEILEALQSIAPGRWRQGLVQRLLEPMQEDGAWSPPELAEEVGLFQAVSEHLLQEGAWPAPHWHCLGLLAAHGTSRLLQVLLGPCSAGTAAGHTQQREALTGALMRILHNLGKALQAPETGHPLTVETPLISLYVCRANSSAVGKMRLSFPSNPLAAASVVLPDQSAVNSLVPQGTLLRVQMVSFLGSPFTAGAAQTVTGTVAELNLLSGGAEIRISNLSAPVQVFLPRPTTAVFAPPVRLSPGEALLLRVNLTQGDSLLIHAIPKPAEPPKLFLQCPPCLEAAEPCVEQGGYTWLVGPEGLPALAGEPGCFLLVPSSPPDAPEPVTIRVGTYGIRCVSWHPPSAQWSSGGCMVGPQSGLAQGHCLCSHLSVFGSSFWVVPAQVDVVRTAEYFGRISKNPVLALLLGALYTLYLLGVAWARWMDVHDRPWVKPAVLASDDPCAQDCYLLHVGLPGTQGHGVTCIQLRGSGGDSKAHRLPVGSSAFLLRESWPLGELQSIWLWQEGGRGQPPQYVTQATALDLQQGARFHFPCHAWLVPAEDGPSTPQGFWAAPQPPCVTFWPLFWQKTLRGLQEEHTLLVVLRPPAHTPFSRVQRLSCGLCLLLCSALISLMFWEVPPQESPQLLRLGSFSLSWKDVMVGVESALITFPINLLVVFIFRHARPRKSSESRQAAVSPSAPPSPSSLDSVLQRLRTAVQALNTARKLPGLAVLQESWSPEVDLDGLLQLLAPFAHLDLEVEEDSPAADPARMPSAGPGSRPDPLPQGYCARYLTLKLVHVARLLEELEPGAEDLRQRVQEAAEALTRHVPAGLRGPRPRRSLPWWVLLVGWALLVSLSAASTFFILLYGFQYGKESSVRWLVATAISLGQSLLVLQPLKVMACAVFCALILKRADGDEEMAFDLEE